MTIASQQSVPDPGGDGIICTIGLCVEPPVGGYETYDTVIQALPWAAASTWGQLKSLYR